MHRDAEPEAPIGADNGTPISRQEYVDQQAHEQAHTRGERNTEPMSPRRKWIRRGIAIAIVLLLIPVGIDYVDYLNKPGSDTISVPARSSGSVTTAATGS